MSGNKFSNYKIIPLKSLPGQSLFLTVDVLHVPVEGKYATKKVIPVRLIATPFYLIANWVISELGYASSRSTMYPACGTKGHCLSASLTERPAGVIL